MRESTILARVRLAAQHVGLILFRNNSGQAWSGSQMIRLENGDLLIKNPRPIKFGLATGSSDLIGFRRHTIVSSDVGRTMAIFTAIETKTERGVVSEAQETFLGVVRRAGGVAGIARSESDAQAIVDAWRRAGM